MYNQCESCNKQITSTDDCKLTTNDGVTLHTYCKVCYDRGKETEKKIKELH